MSKFKNKTAVVTGGSSGIGFGIAKELTGAGAEVIITGRNPNAVKDAAAAIGATAVVSDQAKLADIDALTVAAKEQLGNLDILVLNAGIYSIEPFEQVSETSYDTSMDTNLKGVFFTLQKFLPLLNEGASVIVISSIGAYATPAPDHSVYSASKAAVNALVRSLSVELAGRGIRVNAVCPGPTETPIFTKVGLPEEAVRQMAGAIRQKIPVKRFGTPADIARLVLFLCSEDASFITGADYVIDGGMVSLPIMS